MHDEVLHCTSPPKLPPNRLFLCSCGVWKNWPGSHQYVADFLLQILHPHRHGSEGSASYSCCSFCPAAVHCRFAFLNEQLQQKELIRAHAYAGEQWSPHDNDCQACQANLGKYRSTALASMIRTRLAYQCCADNGSSSVVLATAVPCSVKRYQIQKQ